MTALPRPGLVMTDVRLAGRPVDRKTLVSIIPGSL